MGKKMGLKASPLGRACLGGLGGIAAFLLLTLLFSLLAQKLILPAEKGAAYGRVLLFLCSFCGALFSLRGGGAPLSCAGISGGLFLLFTVLLGLISPNSSVLNISMLFNLGCIICGSFAGVILGGRRAGKRRKRRR